MAVMKTGRAYTGTYAICVFGFYEKSAHEEITAFIESRLIDPFKQKNK